jgi:membrane-associated phospholipid phosphatase
MVFRRWIKNAGSMAIQKKSRLAAAAFGAALTLGGTAAAQTPPAPSVPGFAFGAPAGEALLGLASIAVLTLDRLPQRRTGWAPDAEHAYDKTADRVSDFTGAYAGSAIAIFTGFGLEAAYLGDAGVKSSGVYALRAPLMDMEAAALTTGMVMLLKRVTGRCRPMYFHAGVCDEAAVPDAFPSGHTAPIGAIAGARLVLASQADGGAGFRWASFGIVEAMALSTTVLRVRAGKHSWSDVITGLLLGHAVGALVALAHPVTPVDRADRPNAQEATNAEGFKLTWGGDF